VQVADTLFDTKPTKQHPNVLAIALPVGKKSDLGLTRSQPLTLKRDDTIPTSPVKVA